jgi:O-6-methylguanine DNA methyltransferase
LKVDRRLIHGIARDVLRATSRIPYGQMSTYGTVARKIGRPTASRAVGRALGSNPIPIVIPCHRVIGASGSLTGYGGGLERKVALLELEGALLGG